jgi:hypothetical protein
VNPDVVGAIARLRADGVLSPAQAARFDRVARRELVTLRFEIRALLYAGVLLLTGGVGALVAQHQHDIGPLAIAFGIGLAALGCLGWVARRAAAFSWGPVPSAGVAFDYVLLLGLLLAAADLAYVEAQLTLLGPRWPRHLLVVAALDLLAAYRWDSRTALGLALTSLAAWRGLAVGLVPTVLGPGIAADLRASAIGLGVLYLAAAAAYVGYFARPRHARRRRRARPRAVRRPGRALHGGHRDRVARRHRRRQGPRRPARWLERGRPERLR